MAPEPVNEQARALRQAELHHDVLLHERRRRGRERYHWRWTQLRQTLAQQSIVWSKIVTPLRNAVGFVDGDQTQLPPPEQLRKAGDTQALWRDKQEIQLPRDVVQADLPRLGA